MDSDLYSQLKEWMHKASPNGFRETEKGEGVELLKILFTPDEAGLALQLDIELQKLEKISRNAGVPQDRAAQLLDQLYFRGVIRRHVDEQGQSYAALAFFPGIAENLLWVRGSDKKLVNLTLQLLKINNNIHPDESIGTVRTVPVGQAIPAESLVLAYEDAAELIKKAPQPILVFPCICRFSKKDACNAPLEVCMAFGDHAQFYLDVSSVRGRQIDVEEALDIIRTSANAGLIHQVTNYADSDLSWLCNCCRCCCINLGASNKHQSGKVKNIESSSYMACVKSDLCIGCELCVDKCPVHALKMEEEKAALNQERCIGCGQCVMHCPAKAIVMVKKEPEQISKTPKTFKELIDLKHSTIVRDSIGKNDEV